MFLAQSYKLSFTSCMIGDDIMSPCSLYDFSNGLEDIYSILFYISDFKEMYIHYNGMTTIKYLHDLW